MTFEETRVCAQCSVERPITEFRTYQSGRRTRKTCRVCERRKRRENTPPVSEERSQYMRKKRFMREYGITPEEYEQMVIDRQGRCDICGELPSDNRGSRLHIDHVAGTKRVRGLLCLRCNVGIGMLRHSRRVIAAAHRYLKIT